MKEPLIKIHEITTKFEKYTCVIGELFVDWIIFQHLSKYRMATAVNFDKYAFIRILERSSAQNTWNNTNSTKIRDSEQAVCKSNHFSTFKKIQKSYCGQFLYIWCLKAFEKTFPQNTWNNTNSTKIHYFERVFCKSNHFSTFKKIQ